MRNFDSELDVRGVTRMLKTSVGVTETVNVASGSSSEARVYVARPEEVWEWGDLRDYVVHEIEQRFGSFPRDAKKEAGIFKSFLARWGDQAVAIAKHAFEVHDGWWAGAPISIHRFCKNSDVYFAARIVERLSERPVAW